MNQNQVEEKLDLINKRLIIIFHNLFVIMALMFMVPWVTKGNEPLSFICGGLLLVYIVYELKKSLTKLKGDKK